MGFNLGEIFGGLFGGPELPTSNKVASAETPVVDSVHPRSLCLGNGAWEQSLVWRQSHNFSTNALEPKEALTDVLAIGDHPMGAMTHIWLDDDRYTVGTDTGENGDDFIPADSGDNWQDEIVDAGWYVANVAKFDMRDVWQQTGGDGFRRPAIMFRYYDGTQTDLTGAGGDEWLKLVPGWTDQARAGNRTTLLPVTWRFGVNDRVTPSGRPSILVEGEGATEIYDWRGSPSLAGFSNNAALCFAHALMWEYFPWQRVDSSWNNVRILPSTFDASAMAAAADLCDETSNDSPISYTGVRYNISYQIMSDMDPSKIVEDFLLAMGGAKIFMREGKIVILPGGPRSWSVGFDLEDLSAHQAIVTPTKRPRRSRYNAVRPEYRTLNGGWQFTDADLVAPASYLSDDQGLRRTKKLRFNAIGGGKAKERAQRLAKIWLDRHRLEDRATLAVHALLGVDTGGNLGGALRAEEGDIARLTYATKGWTNKLFEIAAREWDHQTHTFAFDLDEWSDGIDWDGEGEVPDEALERGEFRRGGLAQVENLAWADKTRSTILADGELLVDGVLSWDEHPDTLVGDIGSYRVRYRESSESDWESTNSKSNFKRLNNLRREVEHKAEVRAALPGVESEWSARLTFTPTSNDLPLGSPPGAIRDGLNLIDNARYEQGPVGWDFTALAGGNIEWVATGGYAGPSAALATVTTGDQQTRPDADGMTAVELGQRHIFRFRRRVASITSGTARIRLEALYYDEDRIFVSGEGHTLTNEDVTGVEASYSRMRGQHTVPTNTDIRFMRIQGKASYVDTDYTCYFDDFNCQRIIGGSSGLLTGSVSANGSGTGVGDVWTRVRNITAGTPGEPVKIRGDFEARIGDPQSGTGLSSANELNVRVMRYDEDGTSNETTIRDEVIRGDQFGPGGDWGPWFPVHIGGLDTTGDIGTFIYEVHVRANVNGKWAVRNREMEWALDASSVSA